MKDCDNCKRLKKDLDLHKRIKTDWIESQITDKKFPDEYIRGLQRETSMRKHYDRELKELSGMMQGAFDKYLALLKRDNKLFKDYQKLEAKFHELRKKQGDNG